MATRNSENTYLTVSAAGAINYPVQPAFAAYLSSTAADVTGDSTAYVVIPDTELYDQASNYDPATGIFTAPVTGNYYFSVGVTLSGIGTSNNYQLQLVASGGTYFLVQINPATMAVGGVLTMCGNAFVGMAAANTAKVQVTCHGTTKTVDIGGQATNPLTWFSGRLIC